MNMMAQSWMQLYIYDDRADNDYDTNWVTILSKSVMKMMTQSSMQ